MLENHHHYTTALTSSPLLSSLPPLTPFLSQSRQDLAQHLAAYTNAILHRPVGKLLDFVTSVEAVLMDPSISDPSSILTRPQFTRHQFKKVLKEHDGKEVRKGIEALKKRVEKHFLEDEYAGAGGAQAREREDGEAIVGIVLERCESEMVELHRRVLRLVRDGRESPYRDLGLECEFRVEDVRQGFRR